MSANTYTLTTVETRALVAESLDAALDKTAKEERVKFLPLAGFRQLLTTPFDGL
jgi:hypothetical protein